MAQSSNGGDESARSLVVVTANSAWNIANFRGHLISELIKAGHEVDVLAPGDGYESHIRALGARFWPLPLRASGLSPVADARLLLAYWRHFRRRRPAAMLGFTVKPNIYGSIAANFTGTRVFNNISGLGTAFLRAGPLQALVTRMYRRALARSAAIFFQNPDDRALFIERGLVREGQARLLPGSGVDLDHFAPRANGRGAGAPFRFLLVGRLLWDKGLAEYVAAAREVRTRHPDAQFQLLGFLGADNPTAVPKTTVEAWVDEGLIDYLGQTDDVRPALADADCIVLPSYREGLSRSLIEAAAMARPAIASDVPGCREAVDDGTTGFLCAAGSSSSLADAMIRMIELTDAERKAMGDRARGKAEQEFDQRMVSRAYLQALAGL